MPSFFCLLLVLSLALFQPTAQAAEMVADQLHSDDMGLIHAEGDVRLTTRDFEAQAERMLLDSDSKTATLYQGEIRFAQGQTLQGDQLQRIDVNQFEGENITYSTCPEGEGGWLLRADSATLNQESGTFVAQHAWLEVAGVPLMYAPRWNHALTRRSGLLMPSISQGTRRGLDINLPFYWAAAPNWDMTLAPRWMEKRGVMAELEWRHRSLFGLESFQAQSLFDEETQQQRHRVRSAMDWQLAPAWSAGLHVDSVSDGLFVSDFPLLDELESLAYVSSQADVRWQQAGDSVVLSSIYRQRLGDVSNASTLQILPRIQSKHTFGWAGHANMVLDHQSTWFQREQGVSGQRYALRPRFTLPWQMQGGAVSATWETLGQYVAYDSQQFATSQSAYAALASSIQVQADFERISENRLWQHVVTPSIRLDVSAAEDQQNQPRYDSGLARLTMNNLLRGNRYSGWDRFERMRRVSLLLDSSLQHKTGLTSSRTVLEARVGMAWDGLQESVDVNLVPNPTRTISNVLAELAWLPSQAWRLSVGGQHDPDAAIWVEEHSALRWSGQRGQHAQLSWQRNDASYALEAETLRASGQVNVTTRWDAFFQGQYDVLRETLLQASGGLRYTHPCWHIMLEGFQNSKATAASLDDIGVRFLLEFDGLGSFGD